MTKNRLYCGEIYSIIALFKFNIKKETAHDKVRTVCYEQKISEK